MGKIIACVDGSIYADSVCHLSAWAHQRTGCSIALLHVVAPHSEMEAKVDMTGQIGLGAKANLLEALAKLDEAHGKLEMKKGQLMLGHAKEELTSKGIMNLEVLHQRGTLVESIHALEAQAELIVMGKRGEQHQGARGHLGSNLERVARAIHKPLLVMTPEVGPINKFLIAYDGSASANKALAYVTTSPLFKDLECHLLTVGEATSETQTVLKKAAEYLQQGGIGVQVICTQGTSVEQAVSEYIAKNDIDLLLIGAYGHSKIRSLILGSTTTALICESSVPVMLFR